MKRRASRNRTGEACETAPFKSWKQREIGRFYVKEIRSPIDAVDVAREAIGVDLSTYEHAVFMGVNGLGWLVALASTTTKNGSECAYRLSEALSALYESADGRTVQAIYVAHNHPSGNAAPSPDDVTTTARAVRIVARATDARLIDHVIVTSDRDEWSSIRSTNPEAF